MRFRIAVACAAALALAACSESSTAPTKLSPGSRSSEIGTCRSGYHIATRSDGTTYCEPDGDQPTAATRPAAKP